MKAFRRVYSVFALAMVMLTSAVAAAEHDATDFPPSSEAVQTEVSAVVHAQVEAIKTGDWRAAHEFAAAGLREKFDVSGFEAMIRSTYPALLAPRVATTLRVRDNGVQSVLELRVVAEPGVVVHFRYFLQLEGRAWRIVGVVPYEPAAVRA